MSFINKYDVIVVGAGHSGNEAAAAAANLGSKVLLITMNMETIGQMSCNPAIGGIAKGQIVREIDALGGYTGIVTDQSAIQFKMLNLSKGPAMWSPRSQCDRSLFSKKWREVLENNNNVDFWQDLVVEIIIKNNKAVGVKTAMGVTINGTTVILNSGTFLNGIIHIGEKQFGGGRMGEKPSFGITEQLKELGFEVGRMKTGTPPRVDGRTIDFTKTEEQPGDNNPGKFSFSDTTSYLKEQKSCFITYTNNETHEILKSGFDKSPMFNGSIKSVGPRYCPSIEDKISRFSQRSRHQIFAEPEGWNTIEFYINGFSSSLPEEIQLKGLRSIPGFKNAKMFRPGYAVEYDFFQPTQLKTTLETKIIENLFFSGQINGTTGYEEAAGQGIIAGINAHLKTIELEPFILNRDDAYIGVLIDDLITKGTKEPYRMFTSRAEFRILLRQDNADLRLTEMSYKLGLAKKERLTKTLQKKKETGDLINYLEKLSVSPEDVNPILKKHNSSTINQKMKADKILSRPNIKLKNLIDSNKNLLNYIKNNIGLKNEVKEQAEVQIKYLGYISREKEVAVKMSRLENIKIPIDVDYSKFSSLSNESKEKLTKIKPETLGIASRISGIKPTDISVLMVYLGR